MSLIKNKSNEELWGTTQHRVFRGKGEIPRHRTRIGYAITRQINNFYALLILPKVCEIVYVPSRKVINERDFFTEKRRAFSTVNHFGRFPMKNYIMERCITFEGGRRIIPREHRQYRISGKPIGK